MKQPVKQTATRNHTAPARKTYFYVYGALLLLLFFAVTGFTLNHASWFGLDQPISMDKTGQIDVKLLSDPDKFTITEELRRRGLAATPYSLLSRGIAGVRGGSLVVNLPGSPGGVRDAMDVLGPILAHAVALLRDRPAPHAHPGQTS